MESLDNLTINTLRMLSIEAVEKAKSGHPGLPLGAASAAYTLWPRHLKHDPEHPDWCFLQVKIPHFCKIVSPCTSGEFLGKNLHHHLLIIPEEYDMLFPILGIFDDKSRIAS